MTTEADRKRLQKFIDRISDARARGAQAEIDLYAACRDLEDDGAWKIDGFRAFPQWLRDKGINPGLYQGYVDAIEIVGKDVLRVGLSAAREIVRIATMENLPPEDTARMAQRLHAAAAEKIGGFKVAKGYLPSDRHARGLVQDAARSIGIEMPDADDDEPTVREKYARLLNALEQAGEFGCTNPSCLPHAIVKRELARAGVKVAVGAGVAVGNGRVTPTVAAG